MITKIRNYIREVWLEMGKVTWPTRDELKESTRVVIVGSIFLTLFIFVIDRIMGFGIDGITRLLGS
ncbi:preprotein translocase subunit SecE [bacterium]|nr:preprotein translocase subunit SecE [bacterium]